jgi:hypothetical protein
MSDQRRIKPESVNAGFLSVNGPVDRLNVRSANCGHFHFDVFADVPFYGTKGNRVQQGLLVFFGKVFVEMDLNLEFPDNLPHRIKFLVLCQVNPFGIDPALIAERFGVNARAGSQSGQEQSKWFRELPVATGALGLIGFYGVTVNIGKNLLIARKSYFHGSSINKVFNETKRQKSFLPATAGSFLTKYLKY